MTGGQVALTVGLASVLGALGFVVGRWFFPALPLVAIAVLEYVLMSDALYNAFSEDWHIATFIGLVIGTVLAVLGVVLRRSIAWVRPEDPRAQ